MPDHSEQHQRRSIRLKGYDYGQHGAYYVTICTQDKACLFGDIVDGEMILNSAGQMVEKYWNDIPAHFPYVELDEFIVMPNHVHGILSIIEPVGAKDLSPLPAKQPSGTSRTIGSIVRGFKIGVTKWMRKHTPIHDVWQRNYYDHIIRNESSLNDIREYIATNPAGWAEDSENPNNARAMDVGVDATGLADGRTMHGTNGLLDKIVGERKA